jgi:signal transduction histidine kinase
MLAQKNGALEEMRGELAPARREQERWAAELEARVNQRTEQLAALFELSTEISSELAIDKVLQTVVDKTRHLAGGDVAVLCLLDPPTQLVTVAATSGHEGAFVSPPELLTEDSPEFTVDAMQEAIEHEGAYCPILHPQFLRSHLAVPLRVGNRVVGGLCVGHRQASRFGEEQVRLLTLLADAGAIALENARAYERAEQEARLVERERILAEIHDGLAQTLSFLNMRLHSVQSMIERQDLSEVPEHLALTQHTIAQAESEMRRLMNSLQAGAENRLTLQAQLRHAIEQFAAERELEVEMRLETDPPIHDPPEVCEQVQRVVLEALNNVKKHAPGSQVTVTLERQDGQASVCVRDDGRGFRLDTAFDKQGHFGLKVMRARAERIGGVLDVQSAPGRGTAVTLRWPVQE